MRAFPPVANGGGGAPTDEPATFRPLTKPIRHTSTERPSIEIYGFPWETYLQTGVFMGFPYLCHLLKDIIDAQSLTPEMNCSINDIK